MEKVFSDPTHAAVAVVLVAVCFMANRDMAERFGWGFAFLATLSTISLIFID